MGNSSTLVMCIAMMACSETDTTSPPVVPDSPPDAGPAPDDPCATRDCSNVIDAVMVPMYVAHGMAIVRETDPVLCRRMAIDLTGLAPTPDEQKTQCAGHTPRQMVDYFMNKPTAPNAVDGSPPFVFIHRRAWLTSFNPSTLGVYTDAWDKMVSDVYTGTIGYDEFAIRALGSPTLANLGIVLTNHDLVKIAAQAFRMFMGREALPDEAVDFGNLWRGWDIEVTDPGAQLVLGLESTNCAGEKRVLCQSSVLGPFEMVPNPALPPMGVPGCVYPCRPTFTAYTSLGAADLASLRAPGKAFVARPEFAEALVDRELSELLGWWKAGWYRPDYDLGPVRDALVKKLVADHFDLRKLHIEIATSILYTQSASRTPGQNVSAPVWSVGPTKLLDGLRWLDMLGVATTGDILGYVNFNGHLPPHFQSYLYGDSLRAMGAFGGLVASMARRKILASNLCDGFHAQNGVTRTADDIIDAEFDGVGRPPTDAERKTVNQDITATCSGGCALNPGPNSRGIDYQLCISLFNTSTFNSY